MYTYQGIVKRVIDGDTCVVEVALGFYIVATLPVRLLGINAPELRGETREAGIAARDFLASLIEGKKVQLITFKNPGDKYGRWLGVLHLWNQSDPMNGSVNDRMVEAGHAVTYLKTKAPATLKVP